MYSGIYKIENTINSKVYVGSSNNIKVRWRKHKALLRHNKHPNQHLQNAWNKYGEDMFIFSVIELCPISSLLKGNYIRKYNSLGEALTALNIHITKISCAANGKCNIAGGYVWRFYKANKLNVWFNGRGKTLTKEPYRLKNVKIALTNCNEHLVFKNAKEVSNKLGCSTFQVYNSIRRNSLLLNKYKVERKIL